MDASLPYQPRRVHQRQHYSRRELPRFHADVSLRLRPELHSALERLAAFEQRSLQSLLTALVNDGLDCRMQRRRWREGR